MWKVREMTWSELPFLSRIWADPENKVLDCLAKWLNGAAWSKTYWVLFWVEGRVFCFSSRRRHARYWRDWSSDVCSSDLLRHHPVVGGEHEQEGVNARCAGDYVLDEALVARHVQEARPPTARQRELGVARHDGDAAPMLLLEPVGVRAGQVTHERGLAVVHVPGRPDGERYGSVRLLTHELPSRPSRCPPRPQAGASSRRATTVPRGRVPPPGGPRPSATLPGTPRPSRLRPGRRRMTAARAPAGCRRRCGTPTAPRRPPAQGPPSPAPRPACGPSPRPPTEERRAS